MGNDDKRRFHGLVQRHHNSDNFLFRLGVQVARRLVRKITEGSVINERAILTRCRCPPDSWDGYNEALSPIPVISSDSIAFLRRLDGDTD